MRINGRPSGGHLRVHDNSTMSSERVWKVSPGTSCVLVVRFVSFFFCFPDMNYSDDIFSCPLSDLRFNIFFLMRQRREVVFAFSTPALITYCAPGPEIQSADIRKRLITCGCPHASPGFIYTHPVNSAASEPRLSPDHYLTIHSAVSQSYLKEWPLLNPWLCSSSAAKSQTPAERRRLSSCVHGCSPTTNLLHKCSFRASEKGSNKGDQRGTKGFTFRNEIFEKWLTTQQIHNFNTWKYFSVF